MYRSRNIPLKNKENYQEKRVIRAEGKTRQRRLSRHQAFASNRNIVADVTEENADDIECKVPVKSSRYEQLLEWKRKKEQQKKIQSETKAKEKPPFKCGVVHYKPPPVLKVPSSLRRSDRLNKKNTASLSFKVNISDKVIPEPRKIHLSQLKVSKSITRSFAPKNHPFKAPSNLPKIDETCAPSAGYDTPDRGQNSTHFIYPVQLSPWISHRRGSGSEKKPSPIVEDLFSSKESPENLRKLIGKRSIRNQLCTFQEIKTEGKLSFSKMTSPAFTNEDAENLRCFRSLYEGEMKRLEEKCQQWDLLLSAEDCKEIPRESQDAIRVTVGQTRLLMREKLSQFKNLIDEFEKSKEKSRQPCQVITHSDLQGFWDLVSIQVNDVETKFGDLDMQKCNNWIAIRAVESPLKVNVHAVVVNKNNAKCKTRAASKKSTFRMYLAGLRKKKRNENEDEMKECVLGTPKTRSATPKILITSPKRGKTPVIVTPQPCNTPARSILKCRSSTRLTFNPETSSEGDQAVLRRTPKRVKFSGAGLKDHHGSKHPVTPGIRNSKETPAASNQLGLVDLERQKSFEKDLIVWESPTKDVRRSPRLSNRRK